MDQTNTTTNQTTSTPSGKSVSSKLKKNQTPLLIIILTVLTAFLVIIAIAPKNQTLPTPPVVKTPVIPAETALSFGNATSSGGVDNVDVIANTGTNKMTGVQLELSFDPKLITNISITPGTLIPSPVELLKNIDYTNGRITYVSAIPIGGAGVKGNGVVAHISFTEAGAKGQTISIKFLPKTLVSTEGLATSSLKSTSDFTTVIGETTTSAPSATTSGQ